MDKYTEMVTFLRAADRGNFSAAAQALGMTPSGVSKTITRLEERLGIRLFVRGARTVTLTEEGRTYFRSAQRVVEAMMEADSVADALPAAVSGVIRIHTMMTFAKTQIVPHLAQFMERHPGLTIEFQLGPQFVDLFEHGIDVAIHSGVLPDSSRVAWQIASSRWIVCASPSYVARHGMPKHPSELSEHRCLSFGFESEWNVWPFWQDGVRRSVRIRGSLAASQGDLLREMAIAGTGIVRLAEFHIGADIASGRLVPLLEDFNMAAKEPIYMVAPNRKHLSPRIKVLREFLEEKLDGADWARHC